MHPFPPLPGFGPKRRAALAAWGIRDAAALLHMAPRCIPASAAAAAEPGREMRVVAQVEQLRRGFIRGRGMVVTARLRDHRGEQWTVRWFRAPWVAKRLQTGCWYAWVGRCGRKDPHSLAQPGFTPCDSEAGGGGLRYEGLPEGIGEGLWTQAIASLLAPGATFDDPLNECTPAAYTALLHDLHQADDPEAQERARRALARRELIALHLRAQERRRQRLATAGRSWAWSDAQHRSVLARLPFTLRDDQLAALAAIRADCAAAYPMRRLLQGEVGSGKTLVALAACLAVAATGGRCLLLAPTTLLAEQHARTAMPLAEPGGVALLTQATDAASRRAIDDDLASGRCRLLIGTHALLSDPAPIPELALVVIDEQQRFGVAQRAALYRRQTDWAVDCLQLSATPIPRSLARCLVGDIDHIRLLPRARRVTSRLLRWPAEEGTLCAAIAALPTEDRALIIVPRRDGDEHLPGCEAVAERLRRALPGRAIAILHGGHDEDGKQRVIADLIAGRASVLVSTTVVEVGLDLPDAALLAVLHADRYGLAQLHQLRGRIGRDGRPGLALFCHDEARAADRLALLLDHDDGLAIAEADLARRGPGSLDGLRQHGLPDLRCADLARDHDLLAAAADAAEAVDDRTRVALMALFAPLATGGSQVSAGESLR